MRLVFVCPDMRTGGAQRHWVTLTAALRRRGHDPRVICLYEEGALFEELVANEVPAACAHVRGRADVAGLRRALAEARSADPEVVVSYGVSPQLVAGRAGAVHVLNEHTPVTAAGELPHTHRHQRLLARLAARGVDRVIAVTRAQVEPLVRLGHRREAIEVIPNGVTAGELRTTTTREEARRGLGLRPNDFAALCLAGLRREKRIDLLCEAVGRARREQPRVRGLVAGDGPERRALEPLAAAAGVDLLGDRSDVADLLSAADAFCLPGEIEALPMSILEAMALARPVVAVDVGGVAEAVVDGETGFVVAPGDTAGVARALVELAGDRDRAATLGEHGRERQRERFDGSAMIDAYERALERAAGGAA